MLHCNMQPCTCVLWLFGLFIIWNSHWLLCMGMASSQYTALENIVWFLCSMMYIQKERVMSVAMSLRLSSWRLWLSWMIPNRCLPRHYTGVRSPAYPVFNTCNWIPSFIIHWSTTMLFVLNCALLHTVIFGREISSMKVNWTSCYLEKFRHEYTTINIRGVN